MTTDITDYIDVPSASPKTMINWLVLCLVFTYPRVDGDPRGHKQPFGSHTVPHDVPTIPNFPHPREFFEQYMLPGRPVVFKSVLKNTNFPPFVLWQDDYLRGKYGGIKVEVERGKKESRNGDMQMVRLGEFLDIYKKEDVYMVQDLTTSMFGDMVIPRSIQCGGFQHFIETVVLWFSSGGTKSVVHFDTQENFNCLLDGTKDLVLVDRKYQDLMEADGFRYDGSYSSLDVDSVDMDKFPRLQEVPTFATTLEAGDCMYIPYRWYHQVNSFGSRNLAVNIWYTHVPWFNYTDCEDVDTSKQTLPFGDYGFINRKYREVSFLYGDLWDTANMTTKTFIEALVKPDADDKDAILKFVDKNGDSEVTWEDLLQVQPREFIKRFHKSLDISPTFFKDVEDPSFNHQEQVDSTESSDNMHHDEF